MAPGTAGCVATLSMTRFPDQTKTAEFMHQRSFSRATSRLERQWNSVFTIITHTSRDSMSSDSVKMATTQPRLAWTTIYCLSRTVRILLCRFPVKGSTSSMYSFRRHSRAAIVYCNGGLKKVQNQHLIHYNDYSNALTFVTRLLIG